MNEVPKANRTGERPPVSLPSLVGAAAGLTLLGSLAAFLSELTGSRLRMGGLGISLIFEALGVVLLVISGGRRSNTAGVTLTALGLVPLIFFLFVDVDRGSTLVGGDDYALTATIALLVAAALWMVGHLFGPTRSHALFLGAALVAIWMAITIQIVEGSINQQFDGYQTLPAVIDDGSLVPTQTDDDMDRRLEEYEKYDNGEVVCEGDFLILGDPTFWECLDGEPWPMDDEIFIEDESQFFEEVPFEDEFQFGDEFEDDLYFEEDDWYSDDFYSDEYYYSEDPYTAWFGGSGADFGSVGAKFGWTTLIFGLLYLVGGALFDRRGDAQRGTAFFAVSLPLLYYGIALTNLGEVWQYALLYLLAGALAAYLGASANRRFTAWVGTIAVAGSLATLLIDMVGEDSSANTIGVLLLILGLALAAGAHLIDIRGFGPGQPPQQATPPSGTGGDGDGGYDFAPAATAPTTPPTGPPVASQVSPQVPATAPAAAPPATPPPAPGTATSDSPWAPASPATSPPPSPSPTQPYQPSGPTAPPPPGPTSPAPTTSFDPRPPGSNEPLPPSQGQSF